MGGIIIWILLLQTLLWRRTITEITSDQTSGDHVVANNASCGSYILKETGNSSEVTSYCEYPDLFSTRTSSCEPFDTVNCSARPEPVSPCDYQSWNCSRRTNGNNTSLCTCENEPNINYDMCLKLKDGSYVWPARHWSNFYIQCTDQRTIPTQCHGPSVIYNFFQNSCQLVYEVVNAAYSLSLSLEIPESLYHLVSPRPTQFEHQKTPEISTTSPPISSDNEIQSTQFILRTNIEASIEASNIFWTSTSDSDFPVFHMASATEQITSSDKGNQNNHFPEPSFQSSSSPNITSDLPDSSKDNLLSTSEDSVTNSLVMLTSQISALSTDKMKTIDIIKSLQENIYTGTSHMKIETKVNRMESSIASLFMSTVGKSVHSKSSIMNDRSPTEVDISSEHKTAESFYKDNLPTESTASFYSASESSTATNSAFPLTVVSTLNRDSTSLESNFVTDRGTALQPLHKISSVTETSKFPSASSQYMPFTATVSFPQSSPPSKALQSKHSSSTLSSVNAPVSPIYTLSLSPFPLSSSLSMYTSMSSQFISLPSTLASVALPHKSQKVPILESGFLQPSSGDFLTTRSLPLTFHSENYYVTSTIKENILTTYTAMAPEGDSISKRVSIDPVSALSSLDETSENSSFLIINFASDLDTSSQFVTDVPYTVGSSSPDNQISQLKPAVTANRSPLKTLLPSTNLVTVSDNQTTEKQMSSYDNPSPVTGTSSLYSDISLSSLVLPPDIMSSPSLSPLSSTLSSLAFLSTQKPCSSPASSLSLKSASISQQISSFSNLQESTSLLVPTLGSVTSIAPSAFLSIIQFSSRSSMHLSTPVGSFSPNLKTSLSSSVPLAVESSAYSVSPSQNDLSSFTKTSSDSSKAPVVIPSFVHSTEASVHQTLFSSEALVRETLSSSEATLEQILSSSESTLYQTSSASESALHTSATSSSSSTHTLPSYLLVTSSTTSTVMPTKSLTFMSTMIDSAFGNVLPSTDVSNSIRPSTAVEVGSSMSVLDIGISNGMLTTVVLKKVPKSTNTSGKSSELKDNKITSIAIGVGVGGGIFIIFVVSIVMIAIIRKRKKRGRRDFFQVRLPPELFMSRNF